MEADLSPDDIQTLVAYARGKFEDERYPSPRHCRPLRELLEKLDPPEPSPPRKPYVPSSLMQRKGRR